LFFIIGNQPDFHLNRYKINYLTSDIPDKAIIVLTNSNPFMDTVTNSVVEVSEIYFSNHSPEIPNYNFTDWHTSTFINHFLGKITLVTINLMILVILIIFVNQV